MMEEINDKKLKSLVFKTAEGFIYFDYSDIILCSADGNQSEVFQIENEIPVKVLHRISFIERKYCNEKFIKCHRSHIINLMHLIKLVKRTHQAHLKNGFIVPVSDEYWKSLCALTEFVISED
jgi:DNA-binding LytR/AlgR family response regulator